MVTWKAFYLRPFLTNPSFVSSVTIKAYLQVDGRQKLSYYLFINKNLYWLLPFNNNTALLRKNTEYGPLIYSNIYAMHERNGIVESYQQKQKNKYRNTEPCYIYNDGERNPALLL